MNEANEVLHDNCGKNRSEFMRILRDLFLEAYYN